MTLNPQVATFLAGMTDLPRIDFTSISPEQMRAALVPPAATDLPAVASVRDLTIELPGRRLAARLYLPEGAEANPPLVVFYHGGGWVICSIETHDGLCRALASASGAAVLSVEYRLAPETPFPGPLDDCFESLVWAAGHASDLGIDASRLAVAGDSAGGNLAAAVAICARDAGRPPLRHQLLIYPVIDANFETASYLESGGDDAYLSATMMRWFWQHYVGDLDDVHPLAAPLRHGDLASLPPATVLVAQYDALRDEGQAYAQALRAAGVEAYSETAPGMIHGFLTMLEQAWAKDGARSYVGVTMPQFPNLFVIYGPNMQARSGGLFAWIELWARYALDCIVQMIESGYSTMECRPEVFDAYNDKLDAAQDSCIWSMEGARSYYINEHGRQAVNNPLLPSATYQSIRHANLADYKLK